MLILYAYFAGREWLVLVVARNFAAKPRKEKVSEMKTKTMLVTAMVVLFVITPAVLAGATEIWYSDKDVDGKIYRTTTDGTMLPSIGTGETDVKNLKVIGNEVWFSGNGARIGRFDFDGTRLAGDFSSHEHIGDYALVGEEIWISDSDTSGWVERWTLDHVELPRFRVSGVDVGGILVVPEPAMLSLLVIGGIAIIKNRRK